MLHPIQPFLAPLKPLAIATVLLFQVIIEIIQYLVFSDRHLSLSNVYLKLICVFSWLNSSFLFITEKYSTAQMYHSLVVLSPIEGYLGCSQFGVIMNKVDDTVICVQVSV